MPELPDVEKVAWLALLYRTADREHHTSPDGPMEDLEGNSGEVSLATLEALHRFRDPDWVLVGLLIDHPDLIPETLAEIAEQDPLRAEAALHAITDTASYAHEAWAEPFLGERYWGVELAMRQLVNAGLTAKRDDVEDVALAVYQHMTGRTVEQYVADTERFLPDPAFALDL